MKKACFWLYGISAVLMIISVFVQLQQQTYSKLGYLVLALAVQLIGPVLVRLLRFNNAWGMLFWSQLFIAIAMIIGNTLNGYAIPYFDKVLHFSSGVLVCSVVLLVYCWLAERWSEPDQRRFVLKCLSLQGMNMMIAFLWECFEFGCLIFLNIDAINHTTQGVYDTMEDMIVCFLGGCLFLFLLWQHQRRQKRNPLIGALQDFYECNLCTTTALTDQKTGEPKTDRTL